MDNGNRWNGERLWNIGCGRFYFFSEDGKELFEHPLNGASMEGCSSAVDVNGNLVCDTNAEKLLDGKGRISRRTLHVFAGRSKYDCRRVDLENFPGHNRVLVKEWFPENSECFWLVK